jgi:4-diphosphocytidyl-2-C-methyl-D-erythritol kinase
MKGSRFEREPFIGSRFRLLAYAKINLTLEILARHADGYHTLRSVMIPVGLADELRIEPAAAFRFECDPPALAADNLVVRALARIGRDAAPLRVQLRKAIPAGAGLGGGSSDAAAVFRMAIDGELGAMPGRDWFAEARALGSDIPFFLAGDGALVEGTGEQVTALGGALPPWWVVLAMPAVHVSTSEAYRLLASERERQPVPSRPRDESASLRVVDALRRADFGAVCRAAINDFEHLVAAAYPPVAATLAALRSAGARLAMLSGSGGACFALEATEARAQAVAARLRVAADTRIAVVPFAPTRGAGITVQAPAAP